MKPPLVLPAGFNSWLDYAIAGMDTRLLVVERMFDDGDLPSADDIRAAARARVGRTEGESEKLRTPSLLSIRIESLSACWPINKETLHTTDFISLSLADQKCFARLP